MILDTNRYIYMYTRNSFGSFDRGNDDSCQNESPESSDCTYRDYTLSHWMNKQL